MADALTEQQSLAELTVQGNKALDSLERAGYVRAIRDVLAEIDKWNEQSTKASMKLYGHRHGFGLIGKVFKDRIEALKGK